MNKLLFLIIILLSVIMIRNIYISIQRLSGNSGRVDDLKKELNEQKTENAFLQQKLNYVKSNEFIEKEAREKMGLVKKGEYIVIAPEPGQNEPIKTETPIPNWQKWLKLFF